MPRPERPLDPDADVVQRFAGELRELRRKAGCPGYRELARRAHYSVSTLAQAARGEGLPSLAVTLAYVRACGADAAVWERLWRAAADEVGAASGPGAGGDEPLPGRAPYVGLAAFQVADSEWFFGRDRLIAELVGLVRQRRFVGVFGPSGCGKSSLLRAGLVPAIAAAGTSVPAVVVTPGAQPLDECAIGLAQLPGTSAVSIRAELAADPANLHLRIRQIMAGRPAGEDLVLVVDQFEELFTLCSGEQRPWMIDAVVRAATAAGSRTRVVLGVRADFYGHCADFPHLVDALRDGQILVGPMCPEQLRQAITGPAVRAGCRVETALVSRLVADATGQPGVLPLLSHALLQTWHRRHGTTLTLTAYETAGGIHHAVARTAEATYANLDAAQQRLTRQLFLRLVAVDDATEGTRRRVGRDELDGDDPDTVTVLDTLAGARLVTLDEDGVQLAHEALIRHWPRLRDWLAENREGLRIHRQLTDASRAWQELDRDPGALYRGTRLTRATEWASAAGSPGLTIREREFLDASQTAQDAEQAGTLRRARRLRRLVILLAVLLLLTATTTWYAIDARNTAIRQRDLAIIAQAVNQITVLTSTADYSDRQLALALSLAAYRLDANPRTRGSLISTYPASELTGVITFAPDGRSLANVDTGAHIDLLDLTDPSRPRLATLSALRDKSEPVSAWFGAGGNTLIIAGFDSDQSRPSAADGGHTILVDLVHRRHLVTLPGIPTHAQSLTPDGKTLALAAADSTIRIVDIADPGHPRELILPGHSANPVSASFSPDGHTLATIGNHGQVQLWNITDPRRPIRKAPLPNNLVPIHAAVFSPDSKRLVTTGDDGTIRLWDLTDPYEPKAIHTLPNSYSDRFERSATFSPDGQILATFGDDNVTVLWDLTNPRRPAKAVTLNSSTGTVMPRAAFSPNGHLLATFGDDNTIVLWDITDPYHPTEWAILTDHTGTVLSAAFSPDGQVLATISGGSPSWQTRLWEIDADRIAEIACQNPTVPAITTTDWNQYFPGVPYQPHCPKSHPR